MWQVIARTVRDDYDRSDCQSSSFLLTSGLLIQSQIPHEGRSNARQLFASRKMRPSGSNKSSMVGYRRQKYLVIWGLAILVLILLFYYYFASDGKTAGPLKNLTLILTTTSSNEETGNSLKPYDNAVQFDSVSQMYYNVL